MAVQQVVSETPTSFLTHLQSVGGCIGGGCSQMQSVLQGKQCVRAGVTRVSLTMHRWPPEELRWGTHPQWLANAPY